MPNNTIKPRICEGIIPQTYFVAGTSSSVAQSGMGDKVAMIGAFPKVSPALEYYTNLRDAKSGLNILSGINDVYQENDTEITRTKSYFAGAGSLKYLFHEGTQENTISSVLVCNYTTYTYTTDGDNKTIKCASDSTDDYVFNTELTDDKLKVSLEQLKGEDFDILLLAFTPTVSQLEMIIEWEREEYNISNPVGLIYGVGDAPLQVLNNTTLTTATNVDNSKIVTSIVESVVNGTKSQTIDVDSVLEQLELFSKAKTENSDNHTLYACVPQSIKLTYEDKYLTPVETAAFYCGALAAIKVNYSMTSKTIDYIEDVNENLVYTVSDYTIGSTDEYKSDGYKLVEAGATMFRCTNRSSNEYYVVNSTQPCGLDIAHLRTTSYIIRKLVLSPFLGKINNATNLDLISTQLSSVKTTLVSMFDILDGISYSVERASIHCIKIYLNITYYGIILNEVVYVNEEVI